jgi:hypothetical protein
MHSQKYKRFSYPRVKLSRIHQLTGEFYLLDRCIAAARMNDVRSNNGLLPPELIPLNLNSKEPSLLLTQGHTSLNAAGLLEIPDYDEPSSETSEDKKGILSL